MSPNASLSESYKEKVEIATVLKMLITGLVVVGIVLVVVYWLKLQVTKFALDLVA